MSIYATLWEMKLRIWVRCAPDEAEAWEWRGDGPELPFKERWVEAYAQAVPGHIGHPRYYDSDPYADFLPPPVADEDQHRAVLILDEDHDHKEGQRYVSPLLVLTGAEYAASTFGGLLERIQDALEERYSQ